MSISNRSVVKLANRTFPLSVGTTVQELCVADKKRKSIKVFNTSTSNTVYILSAQNMKAAEGYPVTSSLPYESDTKEALWIVADTGTNDVRVQVDSD